MWNPFRKKKPEVLPTPEAREEEISTNPPPPEKRMEQELDIIPGREVLGFRDVEVAYTLQKSKSSMGTNERNEDAALADPDTGLVGVFDGLGSVKNSYLASSGTARELPNMYEIGLHQEALKEDTEVLRALTNRIRIRAGMDVMQIPFTRQEEISKLNAETESVIRYLESDVTLMRRASALLGALDQANAKIHEESTATTACVGFIYKTFEGKHLVVTANVGDSGAMAIAPNGNVRSLTREDSSLSELMRRGHVTRETLLQMKRQPSKPFPIPSVNADGTPGVAMKQYYDIATLTMRALGHTADVSPSLSISLLEPGEEVVFATDGLIDMYEKKPDARTTPDNVLETFVDTAALADAYLFEDTLAKRVDSLRVDASMHESYKSEDDIAIVAVKPKG